MWVPPEDADPVLLHAPTRKSVALFGAVNLRHGQLVTQQHTTFDALTFRQFLGKLLPHRARDRRMVLILDNARYHHARLLQPFLDARRGGVRLDFLPPYSPVVYARATRPRDRIGSLAYRSFLALLLLFYILNIFGPPPPSERAVAYAALGMWVFVLWGYWLDRHRFVVPPSPPAAPTPLNLFPEPPPQV